MFNKNLTLLLFIILDNKIYIKFKFYYNIVYNQNNKNVLCRNYY
jgi:hypothetical protein